MRQLLLNAISWIVFVLLIIAAIDIIYEIYDIDDDNPTEEAIEEVINIISGNEIDLTPFSPEK